jgi:hypothetical protein
VEKGPVYPLLISLLIIAAASTTVRGMRLSTAADTNGLSEEGEVLSTPLRYPAWFGKLTFWHFRWGHQLGLQLLFTAFTLGLTRVESGQAFFILLPLSSVFQG